MDSFRSHAIVGKGSGANISQTSKASILVSAGIGPLGNLGSSSRTRCRLQYCDALHPLCPSNTPNSCIFNLEPQVRIGTAAMALSCISHIKIYCSARSALTAILFLCDPLVMKKAWANSTTVLCMSNTTQGAYLALQTCLFVYIRHPRKLDVCVEQAKRDIPSCGDICRFGLCALRLCGRVHVSRRE